MAGRTCTILSSDEPERREDPLQKMELSIQNLVKTSEYL